MQAVAVYSFPGEQSSPNFVLHFIVLPQISITPQNNKVREYGFHSHTLTWSSHIQLFHLRGDENHMLISFFFIWKRTELGEGVNEQKQFWNLDTS